MSRRPAVVLVLLTAALALAARAVEAQSSAARIGLLGPDEEPRFSAIASGLRKGLGEHGYRDDAIQLVEGRTRRGDRTGERATVQTLAGQRVAVLFVIGSALVRPAREILPQLPIVFVTPGDPVASGLVASLARPGGNMTAMTFEYPELSGKRLELLREVAPRMRRVLALYDPRATPHLNRAPPRPAPRPRPRGAFPRSSTRARGAAGGAPDDAEPRHQPRHGEGARAHGPADAAAAGRPDPRMREAPDETANHDGRPS